MRHSDYQTLATFRYLLRRFFKFSEEAAFGGGLSPRQYQALLAVKGSPRQKTTIGELAENLQIRHHSAGGLVQRLLKHRLLQKKHPVGDRRVVELRLSPSGTRLLEKLAATHRRELRRLSPELQKLLQHLSN